MTVPAAEKMTARIISTTPVLTELRVCQILRDVLWKRERSDRAITFLCTCADARSAPTMEFLASLVESALWGRNPESVPPPRMGHNTHLESRAAAISRSRQVGDFNHKPR